MHPLLPHAKGTVGVSGWLLVCWCSRVLSVDLLVNTGFADGFGTGLPLGGTHQRGGDECPVMAAGVCDRRGAVERSGWQRDRSAPTAAPAKVPDGTGVLRNPGTYYSTPAVESPEHV